MKNLNNDDAMKKFAKFTICMKTIAKILKIHHSRRQPLYILTHSRWHQRRRATDLFPIFLLVSVFLERNVFVFREFSVCNYALRVRWGEGNLWKPAFSAWREPGVNIAVSSYLRCEVLPFFGEARKREYGRRKTNK